MVSGVPPGAVPVTLSCLAAPLSRSGSAGETLRARGLPVSVSGSRATAWPALTTSQPEPGRLPAASVILAPAPLPAGLPVTVASPGGSTETRTGVAAGLPSASVAYARSRSVVPLSTAIGLPPLTTARTDAAGAASVE